MSWLKTVAVDLLKGITIASSIAQGIDPLVKGTTVGTKIDAVTSELGTIGNLTTVVETMAQSLGAQQGGAAKLAAVLPFVSTLVQNSELVIGKEVQDQAGFEDGCSQIINGIVAIQNSLKAQKTQTTPATPAALKPVVPVVKVPAPPNPVSAPPK